MENSIEDAKKFMIKWNNRFPIDRWWRSKHKVAFLSPEHKECSFLSQLLEYQEDLLFLELQEEKKTEKKDEYIPNIGEWLKDERFEEGSNEISEGDIEDFLNQVEMMEKQSVEQEKEENG